MSAPPEKGEYVLKRETVVVPEYDGNNACVIRMQALFEQHLRDDLKAAIIHGSLGSYEEIPYSDCDALVIIRESVYSNTSLLRRVNNKLHNLCRVMYLQDPLQHHGWFVFREKDLQSWPEHYLPLEALKHAKVITQHTPLALQITPCVNVEISRRSALSIVSGIENEIASKKYLRSMHELKSMLSKLMLLPAMYLQAHGLDRLIILRGKFRRNR